MTRSMMTRIVNFSIVFTTFWLYYASSEKLSKSGLSGSGLTLSEGLNEFSVNLANAISGETKGNVFFSPLSISTSLLMLYYMVAGDSANEIANVLNLKKVENNLDESVKDIITAVKGSGSSKMAYKAFIQNNFPVLESYRSTVNKLLNGDCENIDFSNNLDALRQINSWVSNQTNGKIKDLLKEDSVNSDTVMVLLSAIYFKGSWLHQFDPQQTKERKFHLTDGSSKKVPMMKVTKKFGFLDAQFLNSKVLHIPYNNNKEVMVFVLPNEKTGINKLEEKLQSTNLFSELIDKATETKVKAIVPKFKLEHSIELTKVLKKLGITRVFDANLSDFSRGVNASQLEVSAVQHKAYIEIDEKGTKAAAATGMGIMGRSLYVPPKPVKFQADHPFVFFIANTEARSILFWGRYSSP